MISLRRVLAKIMPKLQAIEEFPTVTVLKMSERTRSNPFDPAPDNEYDVQIEVPCVYSEQPEVVLNNNTITTVQAIYFYIQTKDLPSFDLRDRLIFKQVRYKPIEVIELFGLWKIKAQKE